MFRTQLTMAGMLLVFAMPTAAFAKLRFSSTAPSSLTVGSTCGKFEVVYQNSSGVDANISTSVDNRVRLKNFGNAVVYSNSTCTTAMALSSGYPQTTIPYGQQRAQFYVKATANQSVTLVAEMEWVTSPKTASKNVTYSGGSTATDAIRFSTSAPISMVVGTCGKFTVVHENTSGTETAVSSATPVRMRGIGAAVAYTDAACTAVMALSSGYPQTTMAAGASRVSFYLKDGTAQNLTLTTEMRWGTASAISSSMNVSVTGGVASSGPMRAIWVSGPGADLISGNISRSTFYSELSQKNINHVIIEGTAALKSNRAQLNNFVLDANAHGLTVEVLMNFKHTINNVPQTIASEGNRGVTYAGYVKSYQNTYCPTGSGPGCLVAFHIDFEPHGFDEWVDNWANDPAGGGRDDFLAAITAMKNALGGTPLSADLPHWYDNANNTKGGVTFLKRIYDAGLETAFIMNYTDSQSTARNQISNDISIACSYPANNPKYLVNIVDLENETSSLTFYGQGWSSVETHWSGLNS